MIKGKNIVESNQKPYYPFSMPNLDNAKHSK